MKFSSVINFSAVTILIAISWIIFYLINKLLFGAFYQHKLTSWIFLPAGLRLVLIIIFRLKAIPGLLFGSLYICMSEIGMALIDSLILSVIASIVITYVTLNISKLLYFDENFSGLNLEKLIYISLITALFSSLVHNLYFDLMRITDFIAVNFWGMFIGDFIGTILIFNIFLLILRTFTKIRKL